MKSDNIWTIVNHKKKNWFTDFEKVSEPCWFYNNGGCRHKDGSEKTAVECKYLHETSENVKRPPHLVIKKPCDKFNLEGECKWYDTCKYSHRNLTPDDWCRFYPGIPYTLKTNIEKRLELEHKIVELEKKLYIMEFKQCGMSKDLQELKNLVSSVIMTE